MTLPELLQLSGSYWNCCTLHSGVKLDIFTLLTDTALDAPKLAEIIKADERGVEMLLNALVAMELLAKQGSAYRATSFSAEHLSKKSDKYMGHIIMHHHHLVEGWSRLDEAVKNGAPVRRRSSHEACDAERESFLMGMFNLASQLAPTVAAGIDLRGRRRLLDLGGGPGTYAIHFSQQNPDLKAVIYDLPTTRPFAEEIVSRFGLSERISFAAGDITSDDIGSGYDVVWISHLLHSEGPETSAAIVAKAAASLTDGGLLLIQEFILDDTRAAPLFPALFSLNMLIGTETGQAYSEGELSGMMLSAGLREVKRLPLQLPNGAGIMAGTR
jgi:SAM-dependent methyltransferase